MSVFSLSSELAPFSHALGGHWLETGLSAEGHPSITIHIVIRGYMPRGEIIAMQMNCAAAIRDQLLHAAAQRPDLAGLSAAEFVVNSVVHYA